MVTTPTGFAVCKTKKSNQAVSVLSKNQNSVVSDPSEPWEGVKWRVKVWGNSVFTSDIWPGANGISNGQMAGNVKLDQEEFVCFRDGGETVIRVRDDENWGGRGRRRRGVECNADYWCASLDSSTPTTPA